MTISTDDIIEDFEIAFSNLHLDEEADNVPAHVKNTAEVERIVKTAPLSIPIIEKTTTSQGAPGA